MFSSPDTKLGYTGWNLVTTRTACSVADAARETLSMMCVSTCMDTMRSCT